MAIADAKYRFIFAEFNFSGRRGDGNVFYFSAMGKRMRKCLLSIPPPLPADMFQKDLPFFFIGDAAFSGNPHVVTPFNGPFLPLEQTLFNYRLSRARRAIENAFGIMAARFRILLRAIDCCKTTVEAIVLACLVLHNWLLQREETIPEGKKKFYCPKGFADSVHSNGNVAYGRWRNEKPQEQDAFYEEMAGTKWCLGGGPKIWNWDSEDVTDMLMEHFVERPLKWQWRSIHAL